MDRNWYLQGYAMLVACVVMIVLIIIVSAHGAPWLLPFTTPFGFWAGQISYTLCSEGWWN